MSATRETVERTLTSIVPLPCGHHWWVYSAPTFALGGLAISMFLGRSKLWGAGIGGLLGFLIHRYSQEIPLTRANQVSPALLAAATVVGDARRAAIEAERVARGLPTPQVNPVVPRISAADIAASRGTGIVRPSPEAFAEAQRQATENRMTNDLVAYCRGPYDRAALRNVSQHAQECSAGGWRDTIPAFRCFREPSFRN